MLFIVYLLRVLCVVVAFVACFFSACFVYAADPALRITEIMYDADGADEGKEFVEVVNSGSVAIDMTTVKFFERNDRPDRPGGSLVQSQGSAVLQPGGVAVIVAKPELFLQQYAFGGVLLDTRNFALLNAGATVSLKVDDRLLHSVTYVAEDGAKGDGNSLHVREGGGVFAGKPNPGVVSGSGGVDGSASDGRSAGDGATSGVSPSGGRSAGDDGSGGSAADRGARGGAVRTQAVPDEKQRDVSVPDPPVFVSDPSVVFSASTTRFSVVRGDGEQEEALYGLWNFGDGNYTYGAVVEHAYLHPGAYIVVFQELDADESEGFALQKEIRVLFPQVSIERIDDAFVRLHNRHPFVLDVSGWRIESPGVVFDFPVQSFVPRQNSIVVPFSVNEGQDLFFITAGGGQFSGMPASPDVNADTRADKEQIAVATVPVVERSVPEEQPVSTEESVVVDQERVVSDVSGDTVSVADVGADYEEDYVGVSVQMILIWVVLLVGIMLVALVPFILARREKMRRFEHM